MRIGQLRPQRSTQSGQWYTALKNINRIQDIQLLLNLDLCKLHTQLAQTLCGYIVPSYHLPPSALNQQPLASSQTPVVVLQTASEFATQSEICRLLFLAASPPLHRQSLPTCTPESCFHPNWLVSRPSWSLPPQTNVGKY